MLSFERSRAVTSDNRPLAPGATISAEGQALVASYTGGSFGVKPSTGVAGEQFVGIAIIEVIDQSSMPAVETDLVVASNVVVLLNAPQAGTLRVTLDGSPATVVGGAPAAGEVQIDGSNPKQLNFNAADDGKAVQLVAYKYAMTVAQSKAIQGDQAPGANIGAQLGYTGVLEEGDFYTSEYDTLIDWTSITASAPITLGANGQLTKGGTGTALRAIVIGVPTSGDPELALLGVRLGRS